MILALKTCYLWGVGGQTSWKYFMIISIKGFIVINIKKDKYPFGEIVLFILLITTLSGVVMVATLHCKF